MDHNPKPSKAAPETDSHPNSPQSEEWLSAALKLPLDERESFLLNLRQVMPQAAKKLDALLAQRQGEETLATGGGNEEDSGNFLRTITCANLSQTYSFNRTRASGADETLVNPAVAELDSPYGLEGTDRIGPYSLIKPLGRGGMGKVFLARQDMPTRKVALKLIAREEVSEEFISRFETEYQTMAMMNHPNIAHIFDAGTTNMGHLYLAMEAINGRPITQYCREEALPLNERLYLFIQLCNGIHHAHLKTVIHRDLKPSNILVTAKDKKPVVKIIDFGLAKGTDPDFCRQPFHTKQGAFLGTPAYMSPEQLAGWSEQVDIRSDVYALGIILYELLTGIHPFDLSCFSKLPLDRALNKLRTEMPSKPSWRVKHMPERERQVKIQKELDWVVLKALAKDPKERYASVEDLKEDVVRFLSHQPVRAARTSFLYHFRLFIRRNKAWVSAAALTLLALALGLAVAIQVSRSVRKIKSEIGQSNRELSAANAFLEEIAFGAGPRETDRNAATEKLQQAEGRITALSGGDPTLEATLRTILGNAYLALDKTQPALTHLQRALQLRRRLFVGRSEQTLRSHYFLGRAYLAGESYGDAAQQFDTAASGLSSLLGRNHRQTLQSQAGWAEAQMRMGKLEVAQNRLEAVQTAQRNALGETDEDTVHTLTLLAECLLSQNRAGEAEGLYRRAMKGMARANLPAARLVAIELGLAGSLIDQDRQMEAEPLARKALAECRKSLGETHERTLGATLTLARCLEAMGREQEAAQNFSELLQKRRTVLGETHPKTLEAAMSLADAWCRANQFGQAVDLLAQLAAACEQDGVAHGEALALYQNLGECLMLSGRYSEAVGVFEKKLGMCLARHGEMHRNTVAAWTGMALGYQRLGLRDEASFYYCRAWEVSRDQLLDDNLTRALGKALSGVDAGPAPDPEENGRELGLFALLRDGTR